MLQPAGAARSTLAASGLCAPRHAASASHTPCVAPIYHAGPWDRNAYIDGGAECAGDLKLNPAGEVRQTAAATTVAQQPAAVLKLLAAASLVDPPVVAAA